MGACLPRSPAPAGRAAAARVPAPPAVPSGVESRSLFRSGGTADPRSGGGLVDCGRALASGSAVGDVDRGLESRFKFVHRQYIMIHDHDGFVADHTIGLRTIGGTPIRTIDSRGQRPGPVDGFQVVQLGTDSDHKETRITSRIL